jgi:hypothetical protein
MLLSTASWIGCHYDHVSDNLRKKEARSSFLKDDLQASCYEMEKDFGFSWRLLGLESQTPTIKGLEPPQTLQKDFAHTTSSSDVIVDVPQVTRNAAKWELRLWI